MKKHNTYPLRCLFPLALVSLWLGSVPDVWAGTTDYRDLILGDNPIVYYEFDETSGTTAINSATTGGTYTATIDTSGGPITVGQSSFLQGGTAYDFGGGFIAAASALTNSLDEWSVEAWVNYDSAKTSQSNFLSNDQAGWNDDVLIGIGAEGGNEVAAGNFGVVQQGNPGSTRDAAGAPLAADEWHHVVVTGSTSAGSLTVYIDGVQVAQDATLANGVTFNGADGFGTASLTIGAVRQDHTDSGYRPYDGLLDELAIYDFVLETNTIAEHFNAGISTVNTPPVVDTLNPEDGASGVILASNLIATFSEPIVLTGIGTVTIRNLTLGSGSDTEITLPDSQVMVSENTLTINATSDLAPDTDYAVWISADAIEDAEGNAFAGILKDEDWNFTTRVYRDLVLSNNPVVYYEFNETSGTIATNSAATGTTYDGTFDTSGGPIAVGQSSFAQGGTAYDFGGGFIAAASALANSLDEWTVEAWVNYDSAKTSQSNFLSNDQAGWNDDVMIGIGAEDGNLIPAGNFGVIQQGNPDGPRDPAGAPLPANQWHHVVVTGSTSAGTLTVYIDGISVASNASLSNGVTFNGADGFGTANLTIGAARPDHTNAGYRPYDGLLDELAIYDSVLDPANIVEHFKVGSSNVSGNTFALWIGRYEVDGLDGFEDDPDLDGLGNGLENFFGTFPDEFSVGLVFEALVDSNNFTFSHPQNASPANEVSEPAYEWSTDLAEWNANGDTDIGGTTVDLVPSANDPVDGTTTVTVSVTGTPTDNLFIRVGVSRVTAP